MKHISYSEQLSFVGPSRSTEAKFQSTFCINTSSPHASLFLELRFLSLPPRLVFPLTRDDSEGDEDETYGERNRGNVIIMVWRVRGVTLIAAHPVFELP